MLLKSVSFRDYCLYAGEQSFDLSPRKPKEDNGSKTPVVLFGGKNGAGKTTLLDALRLGLYGKQSFEGTISEAQYRDELKSRIHIPRNGSEKPSSSSISIEFDLSSQGETNTYKIDRTWQIRDDKLDERLRVTKNERLLDEIDAQHWPTFIAEIVPERLSQLFFFDGEKIKNIAEDVTSNQSIATSIRTLLGLDVVERLRTDLGIFMNRRLDHKNSTDASAQLEEANKNIENLESQIAKLKERDLPELRTKIAAHNNEVQKAENKLKESGWAFASEREGNRAKEKIYETRISDSERDLRSEAEYDFPFSLCPKIANRLIEQIEKDAETRKLNELQNEVLTIETTLQSELKGRQDLNQTSLEAFKEILGTVLKPYKDDERVSQTIVHQLTSSISNRIIRIFREVAPRSASRVDHLTTKYENNLAKLAQVRKELERVPDEELVQPTVKLLSKLNQEVGKMQEKLNELESSLSKLEYSQKEFERKKLAAEKIILDEGKITQKTEFIKKLRPALQEYETEITKLKIASLEAAVADCFKRIIRKQKFAERVSVDPETFETNLYDRHNNLIPRSDLSSGEKQIFAIAMLWGLAKTSGRPLPVVIDTPLGRLDSEHRKNLINNYFPDAAHQVIMLSTDTEVDEELYKDLEPHLSHCFHLVYDAETGRTKAENNYFWK